MPSIDRNSPTPFYLQIYEQISQGIDNGLYTPGKKLPSIRECAKELGVSNTTIELAYQKLNEEGYVKARRGSGFVICDNESAVQSETRLFTEEYRAALAKLEASSKRSVGNAQIVFDFAYDRADVDLFPLSTWARIAREVFFTEDAQRACLYNDRQGLHALREQIAHYVGGEYGLSCVADQVLIMPTTRDIVFSIVAALGPDRPRIFMENPGYDEVARTLATAGCEIATATMVPYPAWNELTAALEGSKVAFLTPACQFPTNRSMPLETRKRLLEWAQRTGALLIDDEYGWEFLSGSARIPSLGALDRTGNVATIGTFSNSFTPAVGLSYAILPPSLMLKWRKIEGGSHPQVPWQTQAAMATFMADGHWRTHVRKTRTTMQRKRALLLEALDAEMGSAIDAVSNAGSLFVLVRTRDGRDERELIDAAERAGVRVYPTDRYWRPRPSPDWRSVLVGFASIPENDIAPGVKALAHAWFPQGT